jgi:translation elongation factor EF-Tu-like GTPase
MTMPPGTPGGPATWMTVSDVFHIRGRGTVVTGQLQGSAPLSAGDDLVCDGQRWPVASIEQFRAVLTTAMPGSEIGVLLAGVPAGDALRGRTVTFEPSGNGPVPPPPGGQPIGVQPPKKKLWRR